MSFFLILSKYHNYLTLRNYALLSNFVFKKLCRREQEKLQREQQERMQRERIAKEQAAAASAAPPAPAGISCHKIVMPSYYYIVLFINMYYCNTKPMDLNIYRIFGLSRSNTTA